MITAIMTYALRILAQVKNNVLDGSVDGKYWRVFVDRLGVRVISGTVEPTDG